MAYLCKGCAFEYGWEDDYTPFPKECEGCEVVDGKPTNYKPKLMTNADRIRAMTDEEFAKALAIECMDRESCYGCFVYRNDGDCPAESKTKWLEWLQQPAEGE